MTIRHMAWLTAGIWTIVFALCFMFHSFGFLDKETAVGIVGGGVFLSSMLWWFGVLFRP